MLIRIAVGALLLFAASPGRAAVVAVAAQNALPGQTLVTPVTVVTEGKQISALQFDLDWDPSLDVRVVVGDGLRKIAKVVYSAPQGLRTVRFVLAGMNPDTLADGELLKAFVIVSASAPPGTAQIRIRNVAAADPAGNPIDVQGGTAGIAVQSGAAAFSLALLNAASLSPGPISPGEIITLFGDVNLTDPTVSINGATSPILYSGPRQINAIVPFGLDLGGPATVELRNGSSSLVKMTSTAAAAAPAIFTQTGAGSGPGAVLNQDLTLNTYDNPALRGSTIMVYGTGFGLLTSAVRDGSSIGEAIALQIKPVVTIGGINAQVTYFGTAPGLIAGLTQLNVVVPGQLTPSLSTPLVITSAGVASPAGVTIAVK